jgi:tetratricopeptide (TPR) repeat protein
MTAVSTDGHGNPVTAGADDVALYDTAVDRLLRYHPDILELGPMLVDHDVPMGWALWSYLHLMSTDADDLGVVDGLRARLESAALNDREQAHAAAINSWAAGDWLGAAGNLDDLLVRWPTDMVALLFGHQLDFFLGDAQGLRDRPLRSLFAFDPEHPHAGFVRGMAAFGLEESGHYEQARATGLEALAANPDDVWAVHAVVHTYEMQGLVGEGVDFLEERVDDWGVGNLFTVHNWWHLALYHLEAGRLDEALAIYDREIHNAASAGVPIEMLDASALLWRLYLDDVDTGGRFGPLADSWMHKAGSQPWYAFNDLHAAMALVGAGRLDEARSLVAALEAWLPSAGGTNRAMTAEVGLPASRAVVAFGEGRYDDVVGELAPIRRSFHRFGGSHAQRDALARTLLEAALRAGRTELVLGLTAERLGNRPSSTYAWAKRAAALRAAADEAGAVRALAEADAARQRYARHR